MTTPHITVEGVSIRTEKGPLLEDLSFTVERGRVFAIMGGSGCGKSTLLRHMIGLEKPHAGDIKIDGVSIVQAPLNQRYRMTKGVGVLYQSSALFGSMTVIENVSLPLEEHTTLPADIIESVARQKLALVGLQGFEDYLPDQLSGGMKKRAGLARALALDPPLLFLDEPSAGLDPVMSAGLDELILDLRNQYATTMVVVTHELESVVRIADTVIVLNNKRIAAQGPVDEVPRQTSDPWVKQLFNRGGTRNDQQEDVQTYA